MCPFVARITQCNAVLCGQVFFAVRLRDNLVDDNRLPTTPNTSPAEDLQDLVIKQIVLMVTVNVYTIEIEQGFLEGFHSVKYFVAVCRHILNSDWLCLDR